MQITCASAATATEEAAAEETYPPFSVSLLSSRIHPRFHHQGAKAESRVASLYDLEIRPADSIAVGLFRESWG
jgi:hypothetical protein